MVEPMVVKGCLAQDQIERGARVLARLAEDSLPVHSAAWVYQPESGIWRLYVALPEGSVDRYHEANAKIFDTLYGMMQADPDLEFQYFTVIEPDNPMAVKFREVSDRIVKRQGVRHSGPCHKGPYLEDSYIYRLGQPYIPPSRQRDEKG